MLKSLDLIKLSDSFSIIIQIVLDGQRRLLRLFRTSRAGRFQMPPFIHSTYSTKQPGQVNTQVGMFRNLFVAGT